VGELACGNLKNRAEILGLLQTLPMTPTITLEELLFFVERHGLAGKGIGFVDAHILAATQLSGLFLWTADRALRVAATTLGVAYFPPA
jgi:hypothetical protein